MFWLKPIILVGLLASFTATAPLPDFDDATNATLHHIDIRDEVTVLWRTDTRSPAQIAADGGFHSRSHSHGVAADVSLYKHCRGGFHNDISGYVSTTSKHSVAANWVRDHFPGGAWIYKISTHEAMIDTRATLLHAHPYPEQYEFAALTGVPFEQIRGWERVEPSTRNGRPVLNMLPYKRNSRYDAHQFDGLPHGGAQYPLAGFDLNDPRWNEQPWRRYKMCGQRLAMRAEGNSTDQLASDLDDTNDSINATSTAVLETRARPHGAPASRKRPSATTRGRARKRPHKKPKKTSPHKKPHGTKSSGAQKCTPAMKKAGRCPTTCTAAQKKKNGGKCPEKEQSCAMRPSNKALAEEYLAAVKKGKGGRKMVWKEATAAKGGKGAQKHGKTHA